MSTPNNIDRESFQSLLANAYSVQQSGMAPQSLAAIIELQRTIAKEEIDSKSAMNMIAGRAQAVASASGIGIALLEGNQLVHCAGIGSASQFIGYQLTAVLSASLHDHPRREILRVENASTDSRIEADVCRQFEAEALLLVPIYRESRMIGVLEVLFHTAHRFQEPEVRTYQLMATLAGDASALPDHVAQREAKPSTTVPQALWRIIFEIQQLGMVRRLPKQPAPPPPKPRFDPRYAKVPNPIRDGSAHTRMSSLWAKATEQMKLIPVPKLRWPHIPVPDFGWKSRTWRKFDWRSLVARVSSRESFGNLSGNIALVSLLVVLVVAASVARHHSTVSHAADISSQPVAPMSSSSPAPIADPVIIPNLKPQSGSAVQHDANAPNVGFKRVRVGKDEVDYVTDDVTIRQFRTVPEAKKAVVWKKQVNIGSDVTVRYFNPPTSSARRQPNPTTEEAVKD